MLVRNLPNFRNLLSQNRIKNFTQVKSETVGPQLIPVSWLALQNNWLVSMWVEHWLIMAITEDNLQKLSTSWTENVIWLTRKTLLAIIGLTSLWQGMASYKKVWLSHIQSLVKHEVCFAKIFNDFKTRNYFYETLHPKCLTGFWIHLCKT